MSKVIKLSPYKKKRMLKRYRREAIAYKAELKAQEAIAINLNWIT